MIRLRRAYEEPGRDDGYRVLVDRFWPRGVSKEKAHLDRWAKEAAPSAGLCKWFGHDPERWEEFRRRYFQELESLERESPKREKGGDALALLREKSRQGSLTLVYGARDREHNNAVALKEYLEGPTPAR